jgi:hypothetical protein
MPLSRARPRHRSRRSGQFAVVNTSSLPRLRSILLGLLLVGSVLAAAGADPAEAAGRPSLNAYRGLATWVDMYDRALWRGPEAIVADMRAHGVRTLFLETGNWRIDRKVYKPSIVARYVDAAHREGMKVVAWYVPDFRTLDRDLARSLAAIRFTTSTGQEFDSFGLDIESPELRDPKVRTARMLRLSKQIRAAVGSAYPLSAIVPSPYAMQLIPTYWPGFPFDQLSSLFDVFVPMGYFTFRTNGPTQAAGYTRATLDLLSARTGGAPIHANGGLAENTSGSEVRAYVRTALRQGVIGASLYDFGTMGPEDWTELAAVKALAPKPLAPRPKPQPRVAIRDAPPLELSLDRAHLLNR